MAFDKMSENKNTCSALCSVDYIKETRGKLGSTYSRVILLPLHLFVCLFVCSFVCSFACLFAFGWAYNWVEL